MTREELIQSKEYWIAKLQIDLFNEVEGYMQRNKLNRTQFAEKLGVSKGYISQILNGDADHRISKLVELSLSIGLVPTITYEKITTKEKFEQLKKLELKSKTKKELDNIQLEFDHLSKADPDGFEDAFIESAKNTLKAVKQLKIKD